VTASIRAAAEPGCSVPTAHVTVEPTVAHEPVDPDGSNNAPGDISTVKITDVAVPGPSLPTATEYKTVAPSATGSGLSAMSATNTSTGAAAWALPAETTIAGTAPSTAMTRTSVRRRRDIDPPQ
jgi:hypothetical protein